jgi:hypothetical protein
MFVLVGSNKIHNMGRVCKLAWDKNPIKVNMTHFWSHNYICNGGVLWWALFVLTGASTIILQINIYKSKSNDAD